jgi:hypothetical protein
MPNRPSGFLRPIAFDDLQPGQFFFAASAGTRLLCFRTVKEREAPKVVCLGLGDIVVEQLDQIDDTFQAALALPYDVTIEPISGQFGPPSPEGLANGGLIIGEDGQPRLHLLELNRECVNLITGRLEPKPPAIYFENRWRLVVGDGATRVTLYERRT